MSKPQQLPCVQFELEKLPVETILNIFSFLDIRNLLKCGQVSSRIRAISNDESLWLKLNFYGGNIPYELVEKASENGCKYLSVAKVFLYYAPPPYKPLNLKYLAMSDLVNYYTNKTIHKEVLKNCRSLEELSLSRATGDVDTIENIGRNAQTLKVLNLGMHIFGNPINLIKAIQKLFKSCVELNELKVDLFSPVLSLSGRLVTAIVNNLTLNIRKVDLIGSIHRDEHVKLLVERCNRITELKLAFTSITQDSVDSIVTHLNLSLEKLDVSYTELDSTALLQLRSVGTLKVLTCYFNFDDGENNKNIEELKSLRKNLPQLSINEKEFYIATSTKT